MGIYCACTVCCLRAPQQLRYHGHMNHGHMNQSQIERNIAKVLRQVSTAAEKYARDGQAIRLLAVSKTQPAQVVRAAWAAGLRDFGENYLQEALGKIEACADLNPCWHFIGPVQANKTRALAAHFDWVHSIDRDKLLRRLSAQRAPARQPLNICVQVNISGEPSKSGVRAEELPALLDLADELPRLRLRGLMAIPAPSEDFSRQKHAFDTLAELYRRARREHPGMDTLSMGMSADLEAAVAAGSNLLRIGAALFGPRQVPSRG